MNHVKASKQWRQVSLQNKSTRMRCIAFSPAAQSSHSQQVCVVYHHNCFLFLITSPLSFSILVALSQFSYLSLRFWFSMLYFYICQVNIFGFWLQFFFCYFKAFISLSVVYRTGVLQKPLNIHVFT